MNYTVVWLPVAEQQLAEIWLSSSQRLAVSTAAEEIDEELGLHPLEIGESREDTNRIIITRPLVATYQVEVADRIVRVVNVRLYPNLRRLDP